ncbi:hypothetical protein PRIPAC_75353 [Pristionchus pacificus]|uniref:Uncharacterized protein n=1 Tax=Pristionchus pacificus TaxID=54126 RepID=A0A2A6C6K7_PRIPA|nr:hypothetical protein PRIPAC_75353 [Pristionchus pacificus]|eukprot:PDM73746.1 hypothetical protein PRIPAC_41102 [Pristionchus pacificus]
MRRILGERNQNNKNAVVAPKAASPVFEEWKAVHEVNRAEIGNNGSFLEFGEEAVDCLEANKPTTEREAGFMSQEEYDVKEEIDGRSSIFSSDASDNQSCENDQSEVESASMEIEFSADSCSTPLPSPEVIVVAPSVPLISFIFSRDRIGVTIGTRALWRVMKWSILPALAVASYFYCPYLQYRVDKFFMQF